MDSDSYWPIQFRFQTKFRYSTPHPVAKRLERVSRLPCEYLQLAAWLHMQSWLAKDTWSLFLLTIDVVRCQHRNNRKLWNKIRAQRERERERDYACANETSWLIITLQKMVN